MTLRKTDIIAAGAVVFRPGSKGGEVLLVHRPRYDDWSFPKGKRDRGELAVAAAVREVEEETGLRIRLARPLASQRYRTSRGMKQVFYWIGRVRPDNVVDIDDYVPNDEIDEVAWVPVDKARRRLTYPHDRATLSEALVQPKRTETVIVVRHALSRARRTWHGDDRLRPLLATGRVQAAQLVAVLEAYGVARLVTSPSTRCVETFAPYAGAADLPMERESALTEELEDPTAIHQLVATLPGRRPVAVCSHRPVLPEVFRALGMKDPGLEKGEVVVVHLRKGVVCATERL
ncbi:NUDIX hydrolase [Nocardioides sp. Kera G14]|uniref:NUDIX hydrolase n=1 Tax=Nocardioides sp. Kera G14 TaxID=2884264 RepID=UPI001D105E2C|nr:NUDIX hydrolase [Nocardioides sp. Kera G14]UDY23146.1 NUDIX hydrolase [Nocardioides sp. Kera G14]